MELFLEELADIYISTDKIFMISAQKNPRKSSKSERKTQLCFYMYYRKQSNITF